MLKTITPCNDIMQTLYDISTKTCWNIKDNFIDETKESWAVTLVKEGYRRGEEVVQHDVRIVWEDTVGSQYAYRVYVDSEDIGLCLRGPGVEQSILCKIGE